jgi:ArsR family transcriptional regulator, zinc-responsive transcriptional repressor
MFMGKAAQRKAINALDVIEERKEHPSTTVQEEMALSDENLQAVAFLARSLSDENRLRILFCLNGGKKSVNSIVEELNLSQPLVSHHLKELKRSLLVKVERKGPFIYYEMVDKRIIDILKEIGILGKALLTNRRTF